MEDADIAGFISWFQSNGGYLDTQVIGTTEFPDSGRGAIALCDIPNGHTLFTLPRTLTLSTRTSTLPTLFGLDEWRAHGLHKGWVGLILCLMWEDAWAHEVDTPSTVGADGKKYVAKWGAYMRSLPTTFDTPMFWSAQELEELKGTAVIEKIGRDDAERAYAEQLLPAIKTSSALFPLSHHDKWYTLHAYHRAGSRILSRSFTVARWTRDDDEAGCGPNCGCGDHEQQGEIGKDDTDQTEDGPANISIDSSMEVDDPPSHENEDDDAKSDSDSDSDGDDDDNPSDVAMVPMADLLNARWGSENAKLFHEPLVLRMVTTKKIRKGEQIFNTYGDPPNSELLRRYGHVDFVQLHSGHTGDSDGDVDMKEGDVSLETNTHLGNPSDIVEIRADLVVEVVSATKQKKDMDARIEWWLDEGEDDIFVLSMPAPDSPSSETLAPLIAFIRLLLLSDPEFTSARTKGKLPKGKLKKGEANDSRDILEILDEALTQREGMYVGGAVKDEERLLSSPSEILGKNKRHAVIARLGEKRILRDVRNAVKMMLDDLAPDSGDGQGHEGDKGRGDKGAGKGRRETSGTKRVVSEAEGGRGAKKARR